MCTIATYGRISTHLCLCLSVRQKGPTNLATAVGVPSVTPSQMASDSISSLERLAPNMRYTIEIIRPAELLDPLRKGLLDNLNYLINDAYVVHGHPRHNEERDSFYTSDRISSEDQLILELGPDGLLAICTDGTSSNALPVSNSRRVFGEPYHPGKYGKLVATASLKPWKGKIVDVFQQAQQVLDKHGTTQGAHSNLPLSDLELSKVTSEILGSGIDNRTGTWNWEVAACASVNDTRYRGQGLMIQCLDALVAKLVAQRSASREAGQPRGDVRIKLWSSALVGSGNIEYWTRRGFVKEGEADVAPKGLWTATRDFKIQTLSKVVK